MKRSIILLGKIAVLAGVLVYALSRIDLDDSLALVNAGRPLSARSVDGRVIEVGAHEKLVEVPQTTGSGSATTIQAKTTQGVVLEIPRGDIEGPRPVFRRLPGMKRLLRELNWSLFAVALALHSVPVFCTGLRWLLLLRTAGVRIRAAVGYRVHFLGLFFNTFMPGGTGGDIIKAVAVARHTHRRAEAVTMVLVDRAIGLLVIVLIPTIFLVFTRSQTGGLVVTLPVISAGLLISGALFFSDGFRRLVRWPKLLAKSSILGRIDAAVLSLRHQKRAFCAAIGITIGFQLASIFSIYVAGMALGMSRATFVHFLLFVPVGFLFNTLPLSFGGLGLMEGAFLTLFCGVGVASPSQAFMLGLLVRLMLLLWALPGGMIALTGTGKSDVEAARHGEPTTDPAIQLQACS